MRIFRVITSRSGVLLNDKNNIMSTQEEEVIRLRRIPQLRMACSIHILDE